MITAEELLANNIDALKEFINDDDIYYFYRGVICEFAKEFAEMHVTEVLKKVESRLTNSYGYYIYESELLDVYPLTNIK